MIIASIETDDGKYGMTIQGQLIPWKDIKKAFTICLHTSHRTVVMPDGSIDGFCKKCGRKYVVSTLISVPFSGQYREAYVALKDVKGSSVPYKEGCSGEIIEAGSVIIASECWRNCFGNVWIQEEGTGRFFYSGDLRRVR